MSQMTHADKLQTDDLPTPADQVFDFCRFLTERKPGEPFEFCADRAKFVSYPLPAHDVSLARAHLSRLANACIGAHVILLTKTRCVVGHFHTTQVEAEEAAAVFAVSCEVESLLSAQPSFGSRLTLSRHEWIVEIAVSVDADSRKSKYGDATRIITLHQKFSCVARHDLRIGTSLAPCPICGVESEMRVTDWGLGTECCGPRSWRTLLAPHAESIWDAARLLVPWSQVEATFRALAPRIPTKKVQLAYRHLLTVAHFDALERESTESERAAGKKNKPPRTPITDAVRSSCTSSIALLRDATGCWRDAQTGEIRKLGITGARATPYGQRSDILAEAMTTGGSLPGVRPVQCRLASRMNHPHRMQAPCVPIAEIGQQVTRPSIPERPSDREIRDAEARLLMAYRGLHLDLLRCLILAQLAADCRMGCPPFVAIVGSTGSGKTATVELATLAVGGRRVHVQLSTPEKTERGLGIAIQDGASIVHFDEVGRVTDPYAALMVPLQLQATHRFGRKHQDEIDVPVESAVVLTGSTLPKAFLHSPELDRRAVAYRLSGIADEWQSHGPIDSLHQTSPQLAKALDALARDIWWRLYDLPPETSWKAVAGDVFSALSVSDLESDLGNAGENHRLIRRLYEIDCNATPEQLVAQGQSRGWFRIGSDSSNPFAGIGSNNSAHVTAKDDSRTTLSGLADVRAERKTLTAQLTEYERIGLAPILGFADHRFNLLFRVQGSRDNPEILMKFLQSGVLRGRELPRHRRPPLGPPPQLRTPPSPDKWRPEISEEGIVQLDEVSAALGVLRRPLELDDLGDGPPLFVLATKFRTELIDKDSLDRKLPKYSTLYVDREDCLPARGFQGKVISLRGRLLAQGDSVSPYQLPSVISAWLARRNTNGHFLPLPAYVQKVICEGYRDHLRDIYSLMRAVPNNHESAVWEVHRRINERGIPVDLALLQSLVALLSHSEISAAASLGISAETVRSREKCRKKLSELVGAEVIMLPDERDDSWPEQAKRLLAAHHATTHCGARNLRNALYDVERDARARNVFQYCGAITGRWTASGVNPHNLPKNKLGLAETDIQDLTHNGLAALARLTTRYAASEFEIIASAARHIVHAGENRVLLDLDYTAVEPRILFWLVGDGERLANMALGADPYNILGAEIFDTTPDSLGPELRKIAKNIGLPYLYGASKKTLLGADPDRGCQLPAWEVIQRSVASAFGEVESSWRDLASAANSAVADKCERSWHRVVLSGDAGRLRIRLPSGRVIGLAVERNGSDLIVMHRGAPRSLHGARLFNYLLQGIARDVHADGLVRLEQAGQKVILHVHDQNLIEASHAKELDKAIEIMEQSPAWAPDLPLRVTGSVCGRWGE